MPARCGNHTAQVPELDERSYIPAHIDVTRKNVPSPQRMRPVLDLLTPQY